MMKTNMKFFAAAAVMTLAMGAQGAWAATANGTASATIVNPIAVSNSRDLAFGSIATVAEGGTVALTAVSTTVVTDTSVVSSGTQTSAKFTVTGGAYNTYSFSVPETVTLARGAGGTGNTMSATLTNSTPAGLGSAGSEDIYVGGTLTVGANQANGTYSGTFVATVAYN
ncbi:DUF4402 domain-containing protein [Aquisediminimonas sediminicola]|uniref:DUF4402 domain-containing protein n=1 Tax=Alteraquisediminimonas sediminicola TaxID=2676787 RepID=UPI001C8EF343|nr:DUF4402 domain-containing protein [Aquisediminimonas sediminicola]